jgi:hypothetical protein
LRRERIGLADTGMQGVRSAAFVMAFAAGISLAGNARAAADGDWRTLGFVLTYIATPPSWKLYSNNEDCPNGYNATISHYAVEISHSDFLSQLVSKSPQFSTGFPRTAYASGQAGGVGRDRKGPIVTLPLITKPWFFENAPAKFVQGKLAYGLNLDGVNGPISPGSALIRAHEKFVDPNGEYIDNELYRAVGCYHAFRGKDSYNFGQVEEAASTRRQSGDTTTLIEVSRVDHSTNDGNVMVGIYLSADPAVLNSAAPAAFDKQLHQGIPYFSYSIRERAGYSQSVRGRIVNGVLTTEPADIRIENSLGDMGPDHDFLLRGARLRFDFKDGQTTGMLGGYFVITNAYTMWQQGLGSLGAAHGLSAAAFYEALRTLADGYPDPKTGAYTAISSAFQIELTPAFVIPATKGTGSGPQRPGAATNAAPRLKSGG